MVRCAYCGSVLVRGLCPRCDAKEATQTIEDIDGWEAALKAGTLFRTTEGPSHGTRYAYQSYGCRCAECRGVNAAASRGWRARQKAKAGG